MRFSLRGKTRGRRSESMKEVFVLLSDGDGTMRSVDEPFGVAVSTEAEAKRFVKKGNMGYSQSYQKLVVFDTFEEGIKHWKAVHKIR
jgi:hypothetical protein